MQAYSKYGQLAVCALVFSCTVAAAQDSRYVTENGTTYLETRRVVRQPVTQVEMQSRQETVYQETYTTTLHKTQVPVYTPVTQYTWRPYVKNWWNPFGPALLEYRLTPTVAWRAATHTIHTPVTQRTVTPITRTVQTPVRKLGFAKQEQVSRVVVSRTPIGSPRSNLQPQGVIPQQAPQVASRPIYGGIQRLGRTAPATSGATLYSGVQRY